MRTTLPWVLVALLAGAWIGSTAFDGAGERTSDAPSRADPSLSRDGRDAQVEELVRTVAALRAQVDALQAAQAEDGPVLEAAGEKPSRPRVAPRGAEFREREEAARERRAEEEARRAERRAKHEQAQAVQAQYKAWYARVYSVQDGPGRRDALAEIRSAFDGDDPVRRLAALRLSRWLGNRAFDRADFRRGILPHLQSDDPATRRAALEALAWVKPEPSDLDLWVEAARTADRNDAESTAQALVLVTDGVLRGAAADAVLHLLRDGTRIKKAMVIRGLQNAKEWDPAVEARLVEIARNAANHDYDSHYYFYFVTPRLDPKSDAVLELLLDRMGQGQGDISTVARGFRVGLSQPQRDRAAERLLGFAQSAGSAPALIAIVGALEHVASESHVARLEALIASPEVDAQVRTAVQRAMQAARRR